MAKPKVARMKLSELKKHPKQDDLFGDVPDAELAALAADMAKNGLQHPVEVLPDGTIVAGHQRVRAAGLLGWKDIAVVLREDLDAAGEDAVEAYLISDNFLRRQMSPLAKARCVEHCLDLRIIAGAAWPGLVRRDEVKAAVGTSMNLSPRSVNRYLRVLQAPQAVQQACDRGEITLTAAGKVAGLPDRDQAAVAARIEAGEPAAAVVADVLSGGGRPAGPAQAMRKVLGALRRELPAVDAGVGEIVLPAASEPAALLREAIVVFRKILKAAA